MLYAAISMGFTGVINLLGISMSTRGKNFWKGLRIRDGGFDYTTCLLLTASLQTQASITSPDFLRFVGKAMTNIWLRNTEVKGTGREINEATKLSRVISQSETPFRDVDIERFRSLKKQMTKPERRFKLRPDTTSTRSPYDWTVARSLRTMWLVPYSN